MHNQQFPRRKEALKKEPTEILELKSTRAEMKNTPQGLDRRFQTAGGKKKISEHKKRLREMIQSKEQKNE